MVIVCINTLTLEAVFARAPDYICFDPRVRDLFALFFAFQSERTFECASAKW